MTTTIHHCKDGIPILYNSNTNEVVYKGNKIQVEELLKAYNSGCDKVQLKDNLFFIKMNGFIEFGCLTISETIFKQLKLKIWNIQKTMKN